MEGRGIPKILTAEFTSGKPRKIKVQLRIQKIVDVYRKQRIVLMDTGSQVSFIIKPYAKRQDTKGALHQYR
jgi:hypothetical protein